MKFLSKLGYVSKYDYTLMREKYEGERAKNQAIDMLLQSTKKDLQKIEKENAKMKQTIKDLEYQLSLAPLGDE